MLTPETVTITRLDKASIDLYSPTFYDIYSHYIFNSYATFEVSQPSFEDFTERLQKIAAQNYPVLAATQNHEILGYAYVSQFRPREAYQNTVENSIYLAPKARQCGLGTALLNALITEVHKGPWTEIIAVIGGVGTSNIASLKLHEQCGFHFVGTLQNVGKKGDQFLDVTLMQYHVASAEPSLTVEKEDV